MFLMDKKEELIREIELDAQCTAIHTGRKKFAQKVMDAMMTVDRAEFVPWEMKTFAYTNEALAIGCGQTISQPYVVALMTDILQLNPEHKALEIGTGSGYQSAILSCLAKEVYTIEVIPWLHNTATQRLKRLGYTNIETRCANGYEGWPEKAPFDAIIVTAAANHIPPALIEQLKPRGRLVIPVGVSRYKQDLVLMIKSAEGQLVTQTILDVVFVPLVYTLKETGDECK